jgi:hypothetical protein
VRDGLTDHGLYRSPGRRERGCPSRVGHWFSVCERC